SVFLFAMPIATALAMLLKARIPKGIAQSRRGRLVRISQAALGIAVLIASIAVMNAIGRDHTGEPAAAHASKEAAMPPRDAATIAASPHLLFRLTAIDQNYSKLAIAPLEGRLPSDRVAVELTCER